MIECNLFTHAISINIYANRFVLGLFSCTKQFLHCDFRILFSCV